MPFAARCRRCECYLIGKKLEDIKSKLIEHQILYHTKMDIPTESCEELLYYRNSELERLTEDQITNYAKILGLIAGYGLYYNINFNKDFKKLDVWIENEYSHDYMFRTRYYHCDECDIIVITFSDYEFCLEALQECDPQKYKERASLFLSPYFEAIDHDLEGEGKN